MEAAGLAVGVAPLVVLCLEILDRARDFKEYTASSQQLNARFELAKARLKQWARVVGIVNGNLIDPHHPLLDQPEVQRVIGIVLHCLYTNFGGSIEDAEVTIAQRHRRAGDVPPGWKPFHRKSTDTSRLGKPGHSNRNALLWATGHKRAFTEQVDVFEILVERLHDVVPLDTTEHTLRCAAEALERIESTQEGMLVLVKNMQQEATLKKTRLIDEWLGTPLVDQDFEKHVDTRLQGTCGWLFKNDKYVAWEKDDPSGDSAKLFWLYAPPGHGKTVLAAVLTQHMIDVGTAPVAYFFSSSHVQSGSPPEDIIRYWISQLTRADGLATGLTYNQLTASTTQKTTRAELWKLFRDVLLAIDGCTLILDGFDEFARCDDARKTFLQQLKKQIVATKTRVFVSSRPEDDIEAELRSPRYIPGLSVSSHRVTSKDLKTDIALYSRHTVTEQLPDKDQIFQQELADSLASKCDGMFLWIKLQKSQLRDGKSKKRLRQVVGELPDGLTQSYDRSWSDVMAKFDYDRQRAIEILRWTCFARRPLTVLELTEALVHGYNVIDSCEDDMPDKIDDQYVDGEIKGLCGSLIEVRQDANIADEDTLAGHFVHLVHVSAREFLITKLPAPFPVTVKTRDASSHAIHHMHLAEVCLRYLNCDLSWKSSTIGTRDDQVPFQTGLMKYAATSWYEHWQLANTMSDEYKNLTSKSFAADSPHFDKWARNDRFYEVAWTERKNETGLNARLYMAVFHQLLHVVDHYHACGKLDFTPTSFTFGTALSIAVCYEGHAFEKLISRGADINVKCGAYGSALGTAVTAGKLERVQLLLDQGADVEVCDWKGVPILTSACFNNDLDTMQLLLDHNSNASVHNDFIDSSLLACIHTKNPEGVRLLLDHGADIALCDDQGWSLLHCACWYDNVETVNLLLNRGADILSRTDEGLTPLHIACDAGQHAIVKALLEWEPNLLALVETSGTSIYHPVHCAAKSGSVEILKVLMEYGADVRLPNEYRLTALGVACRSKDTVEAIKFLLDNGADITFRDRDERTPLHNAVLKSLPDVTRILLERGADMYANLRIDGDDDNDDYLQPIHLTTLLDSIEPLQILLDHGADINTATTLRRLTPLHLACSKASLDMIRFLVEKGADPRAKSRHGSTPWHEVCRSGSLEAVSFFLENSADISSTTTSGWTALHSACWSSNLEVVKLLVQKGGDLSAVTDSRMTLLHVACRYGSKEIVEFLIERGADVSRPESDTGCTPLHLACESDRSDVVAKVKLLLQKGADMNQKAEDEATALHLACSNANAEASQLVSLLLDEGANPTQRSDDDVTPLHEATRLGNLDTIRILLEKGTPFSGQAGPAANSYHLMHFAVKSGKPEVVQFFIEKGVPIDPQAKLGMTPLMLATSKHEHGIVKKLVDAGADIVSPYWFGRTALDMIEKTWSNHEMTQQWRSGMKLQVLPHDRVIWLKQQISDVAQYALSIERYPDKNNWPLFTILFNSSRRLKAKPDFIFASRQIPLGKNASGQKIHTTIVCNGCDTEPVFGERWLCFTCLTFEPLLSGNSVNFCGSCKARPSGIQRPKFRECSEHDLVLIPSYEGDGDQTQADRLKDPEVREWLESVVTRYKVDGPLPSPQPIT